MDFDFAGFPPAGEVRIAFPMRCTAFFTQLIYFSGIFIIPFNKKHNPEYMLSLCNILKNEHYSGYRIGNSVDYPLSEVERVFQNESAAFYLLIL